ncbi:hypothetical protein FACS1894189_6150 [Planctomycetales bacterium]|nr:hypothetical protein FACS1894189_6150 [Planctomycetales bacterium]
MCDYPQNFCVIEPFPKVLANWAKFWNLPKECGGIWQLEPDENLLVEVKDHYQYIQSLLTKFTCAKLSIIANRGFVSVNRKYRRYEFKNEILRNSIEIIQQTPSDPFSGVRVEFFCDIPFFWEFQEICGYSLFPDVMLIDVSAMLQGGQIQFDFNVTVYPAIFSETVDIITNANKFSGLQFKRIGWSKVFQKNKAIIDTVLQEIILGTSHHLSPMRVLVHDL